MDAATHADLLERALRIRLLNVEPWSPGDVLLTCSGGTLFLDRIERLSSAAQQLLLAFIHQCHQHEDEPRRIGQIVVGSSVQLSRLSAAGRFLPLLYDELDKVRLNLQRWRG